MTENILIEGKPEVKSIISSGFTLYYPKTLESGYIYFKNDKHAISFRDDPKDPLCLEYYDVAYGEVIFLNDELAIIEGRDLEYYVISENLIKWKY